MNEDMNNSSNNNNDTSNEKSNANSSIRNSQTSFDRHHRQSNSFNLFANSPSASTPLSLCDPNDELWFQFLSSLQEPAPLDGQTGINNNTSFNSRKDVTNPDDDDDPDFTVCLENVDVDDRDFLDDWFQVPKKEAVALVKDAIEFCDGVPIVYEDYRSKTKLKSTRKSHDNEANTSTQISDQSSINNSSNLNINDSSSTTTTNEEKSITDDDDESQRKQNKQSSNAKQFDNNNSVNDNSKLVDKENAEFLPQFTDLQRKQLDEQLRNHTQLLTQTCLVTYCSNEHKSIFLEAFNLLNVLKRLTKLKPTDSASQHNDENEEEEEDQCQLLSSEFKIVNLKDAINIIESLEKIPSEDLKNDLKQGVPAKILELVVNSPVFYNTNLIPNLKYKYQSHFKRSLFSDIEKILLIMGFNQFKHLPKSECCQCIKDHLLPHRSIHDIRKQLCNISNSEQRQMHLKELLKKQKQMNPENYEFDVERNYKSPLEQSDNVQLPSMYTMIVERLKMANILKDTKKHLQEKRERELNNSLRSETDFTPNKSDTNNKKKTTELSLFDSNRNETPKKRFRTCSVSSDFSSPSHFNTSLDCSAKNYNNVNNSENQQHESTTRNDENQQNQTKRSEMESSIKITRVIKEVQNDKNMDAISKKNNLSQNKPTLTNNPTSTPIMLNSISSLGDLINLSKIVETPTNHQSPIIAFSSIDFNKTASNVTIASTPAQPASTKQPTQAPIVIPANFNGTILIQPTIHIHTGSHTNFSKVEGKFRQIQPKDPRK